MQAFPVVDPIPLPAPVWLFVALHSLTFILHVLSLQLLISGLGLATVWSILGRFRGDDTLGAASRAVAQKLPIVMTYVINLGVPPLLFAQVLYGRALYTSSVLIGVFWIGVIFLLMIAYSLLYVMVRRGETRRGIGWAGLFAFLVVLMIAMIYSTNMTLMLRPETWQALYRAHPSGTSFHTGDPTVLPRWLFMTAGSVGVGGVGLLLMALKKDQPYNLAPFLQRWGGRLIALFVALQLVLGFWVLKAQPEAVLAAFSSVAFYRICEFAWLITAVALIALGALASLRSVPSKALAFAAVGASFLNVTMLVLVRDGIRYAALKQAGFNVWDRTVSTNWSTVILFLLCFVVTLGMVGWLGMVVAQMKPKAERSV
ncbi:MAG: hypothetical protein RBU21_08825 [FCB group bacterium]|jgi:hypothetical protein|nr:hypothetical protein [FCB group bacterium]